jgi:hypothetical protein
MDDLDAFNEIWLVDFEFSAPDGERPRPLCFVAKEARTGRAIREWLDDAPARPPFAIGPDSLFVSYYASAELGCFLALNWPMPARILDLYAEFRCLTSGRTVPCGHGLLGALSYHGLDGLRTIEKESMRLLALRGGPYSPEERSALVAYCESDVDALNQLLWAMLPRIDLPRALLRGRYMAAAARIEWRGVPIDSAALALLRSNWDRIKANLINVVNTHCGVFVPAGQREIDPASTLGKAILETAEDWHIDPHHLADAVSLVSDYERAATHDAREARRAARKATGLTAKRIEQWENAGHDYADYPSLDVAARELAGMYPELGIGGGYRSDDGADDTNHAGLLWEQLRIRDEKPRPRHDSEIIRKAAELVVASPGGGEHFGPMTFSAQRFAGYLRRKGIPWPRRESGALALDDDTFREMARAYPTEIGPIRELRYTLSQLRLNELVVGSDGRNRCLLSAFASRTGRNQPSNSRFIFGPSTWLRSLIRPETGRALAYVDYEQQEFGIAAALSGDAAMMHAYQSGDPYLTFAKQAGAVPSDGTKETHKAQRERFKVLSLAVQYGMGPDSLARRLEGRWLLIYFGPWVDRTHPRPAMPGELR